MASVPASAHNSMRTCRNTGRPGRCSGEEGTFVLVIGSRRPVCRRVGITSCALVCALVVLVIGVEKKGAAYHLAVSAYCCISSSKPPSDYYFLPKNKENKLCSKNKIHSHSIKVS